MPLGVLLIKVGFFGIYYYDGLKACHDEAFNLYTSLL